MKKRVYVIVPAVLVAASLVFAGKRTNPPVERQIEWSSPDIKQIFYRSCADCHSHETAWPWYAHVAPISWQVIKHVNEGRAEFNISTPDMGESNEAAESVQEREMPPRNYVWLHPEAQLSVADMSLFIAGLQATFSSEGRKGIAGEEESNGEQD